MNLTVNASKRYNVSIENGLSKFLDVVAPHISGQKIAIITDENVNALYDNVLPFPLEKKVFKYVVKPGEDSKCGKTYLEILNKMAEDEFSRNDAVVTLGGGVVGDLGAFVASTYMRGIKLIAVPTTLLSMVDSSVGGKTAINLNKGKNLCGTFYQPDAVYINVDFLNTLPEREIKCGKGEVVKYSFLVKSEEKPDLSGDVKELIYDCLRIKAKIVEEDESESGARKLLNLGHTVGHAIEKLSHFTLSHGECVAEGLYYTLNVSKKRFGIKDETINIAKRRLQNAGFEEVERYSVEDLISVIKSDKKVKENSVDFVFVDENLIAKVEKIGVEELGELMKR